MDSFTTEKHSREPKALRIRNDSELVTIVKHITKSNGAKKAHGRKSKELKTSG